MAAINTTFNSILTEIQMCKLNFAMHLTPYAAHITLKKSTQVDRNGVHATPSPPVFLLLQQSYKEQSAAREEIARLMEALRDSEKKCLNLTETNASLLQKLKVCDEDLVKAHDINDNLMKKLAKTEQEVIHLTAQKKELKSQNKELIESTRETDLQFKTLNKTLKLKEKEMYNLEKKLTNSQNIIANNKTEVSDAKARESKLQLESGRLLKQLQKLKAKKPKVSHIASQTSKTNALPPILGSQVCYKKSQSMPTLYFEYEKVRCSTCGLPFSSTIELADHDEVYKFCCRVCSTCYRTYQEALPCCLEAGHA